MAEHDGDSRNTVAVAGGDNAQRQTTYLRFVPAFLLLLIFYTLIKLVGFDVRAVLFTLGGYALTWVEVLHLVASLIAMMELLKVSHPGENNTWEVVAMLGIWVVYFLFFVLGASGGRIWIFGFAIFSTTEFLMLTIISGFQVIAGFFINARTLQRTISDTR